MKPWIATSILIIILVAIVVIAAFLMSAGRANAPGNEGASSVDNGIAQQVDGLGTFYEAPATSGQKTYRSEAYGISFSYPQEYLLFTSQATSTEGKAYGTITLYEDSEMMRDAIAGTLPRNTEWPPAIHFSFHPAPDGAPATAAALEEWIRAHPMESIYIPQAPGGDILTPTTVAGRPALAYDSPGLYWVHAVAFMYGDWIAVASVDTFEPEGDPRADDFAAILQTVTIN